MGYILGKPKTYSKMLEQLKIPKNIPKKITCKFCGEPMYLTPINDFVCFWIHKGKSIKVCADKNPFHPGHPMIVQNMKLYKTIHDAWGHVMEVK